MYLNGVDFPVWIAKHVFKNKDGSTGTLYLCTNDPELDGDQMLKVYQRRWPIEEFHKSLKQNASLAKCPASRPELQRVHLTELGYCGVTEDALRAVVEKHVKTLLERSEGQITVAELEQTLITAEGPLMRDLLQALVDQRQQGAFPPSAPDDSST